MFKSIGLVIKHRNPDAAILAQELAELIVESGARLVIDQESPKVVQSIKKALKSSSRKKKQVTHASKAAMVSDCDMIVVLGGDGTYLSVARLMGKRSIPVLGVNLGQLGFLTEIKRSEAYGVLKAILQGKKPKISYRSLLRVQLLRGKKVLIDSPVVNDAVISKGAIARIIGMQISTQGKLLNSMRADGLIVATPTGSTAYSLAAGGPIVEPSLGAMILAPICPHSLTQRPLVISDDLEIEISLSHKPGQVLLTLDGQEAITMQEEDVVKIQKFKNHPLELISSPTRDYFSLLREKLKLGLRD